MSAVKLELVIARYQEDLAWVRNLAAGIRVCGYNKGAPQALVPDAIDLPNHGREAHTYLHHILTRYDTLAELTVFCQGKPFDHAPDFHRVLRDLAAGRRRVERFLWLGFLVDTDDPRGRRLFVPWSKNPAREELPLDVFYEALLGAPCPEVFRFHGGAQFAVTAAAIRSRPRSFYERALALVEQMPLAPHCLERMWDQVFGVTGVSEEWMAGRQTVYLKPIKRLADAGVSAAVAP